MEDDEAGAWGYTSVNAAYAYNLRLSSGARLAAGISAGFFQHRLEFSLLDMPEVQVANDPAVFGDQQFIVPIMTQLVVLRPRQVRRPDHPKRDPTVHGKDQPVRQAAAAIGAACGFEVELDGRWTFLPSAQARLGSVFRPLRKCWAVQIRQLVALDWVPLATR